MKRIAFILQANQNDWLGGLSYLRNLLRAILSNPERHVEPVLVAHSVLASTFLSGFPPVEVIRTPMASRRHPARLLGEASCRLIDRDVTMEWLLRKHRIDALSHSLTVGARSAVASIGWIPDFQHVRMPQFFSRSERVARDRHYLRLAEGSRCIILSSNDVRSDFVSFAPHAADKACVLHFVSYFESTGATMSCEQLRSRFGIDRPFFHLPNQFWAHKNHAVVVEALGILKKRGIDALVLATGRPADYRNPEHFGRLMARVKVLGVEDNFRVLGVVTLPELQSLMLNAIALINPSYFEGWSTTVEESKSLGLPIILSDISVHVEQAPPLGHYFKADSPEELAEAILATLRTHDPAEAAKARQQAALELPERVRRFGKAYDEIANKAIDHEPV
ncbi:MAG TPA: glycosyltransferase family 1 protein [Steroidobacteraceae bacterium]|nr:glycosyltransferase family 1 protein [Steroidobacteraceae bacterium]